MRKYETFIRNEKGRYIFLGWYPMQDEEFLIETKERTKQVKDWVNGKWVPVQKTFIYKTYQYKNGRTETLKYGSYVEEAIIC